MPSDPGVCREDRRTETLAPDVADTGPVGCDASRMSQDDRHAARWRYQLSSEGTLGRAVVDEHKRKRHAGKGAERIQQVCAPGSLLGPRPDRQDHRVLRSGVGRRHVWHPAPIVAIGSARANTGLAKGWSAT